MLIGIMTGSIFSLLLIMTGIMNIITGKILRPFSIIVLLLYLPTAYFSGLTLAMITHNFLAAILIMALTIAISTLIPHVISFNAAYFIGSVIPWVGTGMPLISFLFATVALVFSFILIEYALRRLRTKPNNPKSPPIGLAISLSALFYSPFALFGLAAMGIF